MTLCKQRCIYLIYANGYSSVWLIPKTWDNFQNCFLFQNQAFLIRPTFTTVLNLKKALSKFWVPSILRTLSTTAKNSFMAWVYLTWISLTKASRLILPAPPISAASASRRKWRVVSTSSSTSLHLWYNQCFVVFFKFSHTKTNISIHWLFEFKKPVIQVNSLLISFYKFSYTKSPSRNLVFFFWSMFLKVNILQAFCYFDYLKLNINYLSMKLFKRSKQGAFLGGQGLSVHSSSSVRESLLEWPSPCLRPYLGVYAWGPYILVRNKLPCGLEALKRGKPKLILYNSFSFILVYLQGWVK